VHLEITLGYVYKEKGDYKMADETYNQIIENLRGSSKAVVINVGNLFFNRREFEFAEKTYFKGREVLPGEMFHNNLASIYAYSRNYEKMMVEYLALVIEDEEEVPRVQARISSLLHYDFDNSLKKTVKRDVIRALQAKPDVIPYTRLLIWILVIEKNYDQALNNAIALDRRTKTEENSIVEFARSAAQIEQFEIALRGLNYLTTRKPVPTNLNLVKQEIVIVEYMRFMSLPPKQRTNGQQIAQKFENLLIEIGYTKETVTLIKNYAHMLSFYLNNTKAAYAVLDKGLSITGLSNIERSILRIEMADINVFENKLWEATLLYAQIVDVNKDNALGDEVKLKRAKLSFYIGDVEWARAQLDNLKASTSKLIANDAMELSLLITANYDLDTIAEPMQKFARADLLLFQNNDSLAMLTLDSISKKYPYHTLNEHIMMRKAGISKMRNEYTEATTYYETIMQKHPWSTVADDALYNLALLYENKLNKPEKAQELYKQMMLNYPGSIYVADSRFRYRVLRGDEIVMPEASPYEINDFNIER
jgi:tetratricopeptide (TPR) repeat protein